MNHQHKEENETTEVKRQFRDRMGVDKTLENTNILGVDKGKNCVVFTVIFLASRECLPDGNTQ